jgi:hypothetical protein
MRGIGSTTSQLRMRIDRFHGSARNRKPGGNRGRTEAADDLGIRSVLRRQLSARDYSCRRTMHTVRGERTAAQRTDTSESESAGDAMKGAVCRWITLSATRASLPVIGRQPDRSSQLTGTRTAVSTDQAQLSPARPRNTPRSWKPGVRGKCKHRNGCLARASRLRPRQNPLPQVGRGRGASTDRSSNPHRRHPRAVTRRSAPFTPHENEVR